MRYATFLGLPALIFLFTNCNNTTQPSSQELPQWMNTKISNFKSEPISNPPRQVNSYRYQNETVYYIPAICCDQFGTLYTLEGDTICFPDGGLDGKGDGRCKDFIQTAKDSALIWKDIR